MYHNFNYILFMICDIYTLGGRDFMAVSGFLNFLPSETHKNISITIQDDGIVEGMEYFFVQLYVSGGLQTNVILGAANHSVVNIIDSGQRDSCEFVIISSCYYGSCAHLFPGGLLDSYPSFSYHVLLQSYINAD